MPEDKKKTSIAVDPKVIAEEIVEDMQSALEQFSSVLEDLRNSPS